ncbi:Metal-dependent protein hydrolase [Coniochaeta hoffmannii]|uniref:Metal-dependent protein hydrolase n=1 Tax=Coniochaeta hoffmannii TaxID=91930 RepID=A0AA38RIP7_9PEZI|nr:Metal-dependent protein hydrolase [Coniochaeta hoffmannii]
MTSTVLDTVGNAAKRLKTEVMGSPVTIGTHNGHFHADEALAVHMLRKHIPAYSSAKLIRTRDPAVLATCHTVVDVGGEYDPAKNRYDHHQRTFDTVFPGRATKLSSAGLVYMHFGKEIVARSIAAAATAAAAADNDDAPKEKEPATAADEATVDLVWNKIYTSFIEAVDANDNGVSVYDPAALAAVGIEKRFSDGGFTLGAMVSRLNPNWNDPAPADPEAAQKAEDDRFLAASARIGEEFDRDLEYYTRSWLPAREIVEGAFRGRKEVDPTGRILVFMGQSVPWKDHLYTLEEAEGETEQKVLYVLYPEKPAPDSKWRVQAVPLTKDSFQSRRPLPEAWRGVRDEELSEKTGIPGGVFVHAAGFIGGNKTFEGALAMAKKALEM